MATKKTVPSPETLAKYEGVCAELINGPSKLVASRFAKKHRIDVGFMTYLRRSGWIAPTATRGTYKKSDVLAGIQPKDLAADYFEQRNKWLADCKAKHSKAPAATSSTLFGAGLKEASVDQLIDEMRTRGAWPPNASLLTIEDITNELARRGYTGEIKPKGEAVKF